jgi:hypothetical protein
MSQSQRSIRLTIIRTAILAIITISSLSIAAAGASAAGFSIFDSVGEFFGLLNGSSDTADADRSARAQRFPLDSPLHVYGTGWLRPSELIGQAPETNEIGGPDKFVGVKINKDDPLVPRNFDCTSIHRLGIDRQENLRAGAIMIACGQAEGGSLEPEGEEGENPSVFGGTDRNLITGTETAPNITQSETFTTANPDNPMQIVVAYNDSRGRNASPINISGASISTDGGTTFTRITTAGGQSPFSGTEGDPVVLYHRPTGTWVTVWLDTACGGQGLGGYKSTTPANAASWTHFCMHNNSQDDRNSGWADNGSSSPFFGRMYISYNDFNVGGGALFVGRSTDAGTTWSAPVQVTTNFIRDVQLTGDSLTGTLYLAGMDEMGGGLTNRANKMYRSTDGGVTWTNTYTGPTFPAPGRTASGFFGTMYSSPAYWRHQGWGEPAALNNVVSYVYDSRNTGNGDPANVFYIRSTDSGVTFSAPLQLNTDVDATKAQWQPNLSVSPSGTLLATWYDETPRTAASCQPSSPATPCYQMYSRKSLDNGLTWLAPMPLSDVASPLPLQGDPGIQVTYAGDYDYGSAILAKHNTSWVDGRVAIAGASQQDAFTDAETALLGTPTATNTGTPSPTPTFTPTATATCAPGYSNSTSTGNTVVPGTTLVTGSNCDDCSNAVTIPFPFTFYGTSFTSVNAISNGNLQFTSAVTTFTNTCLPAATLNNLIAPHWDDLLLTGATDGIYTSTSGAAPNRIFNIEWRGGYFSGGGLVDFEARLYETSGRIDFIYGTVDQTGSSATVGLQQGTGATFTQFECNTAGTLSPGFGITYLPTTCASPSATPTNTATATATATPTATATGTPSGMWAVVAPLAPARYANRGRSDGLFYYSVGGSTIGATLANVDRYDPVTNTWLARAPIPTPVLDAPVVYAAGKLYVLGGWNDPTNVVYDLTQIYDIATNTWSTGAPMPGVRMGSYVGTFGGKIYVAGGFTANDINTGQNTTFEYTIATNTWVTRATMPNVNALGAYSVAGQFLYTFGGWRGNPCCNTDSYRYDMVANVWTTLAALPTGLEGAQAATDPSGNLLIYGGGTPFSDPAAVATTYVYNPGTNTYSTGPSLNQARVRFAGGNLGNSAMAVAGYTGTATTGITERLVFAGATPTATATATATVGCTPGAYNYSVGAGAMIPGTTRIDGAGCDDCVTAIAALPFPVSIYGTSYTAATAGSNGILAFGTVNNAFQATCFPVATATNELMPFYRDQRTDCASGCGIFTATTGTAPNRVFTIEYRTIYFGEASTTPTLDYEVNLRESGSIRFDYTYGLMNTTTQTARVSSIGTQRDPAFFTQYACDPTGQTPPVTAGQRISWTLAVCGTPTNTATATATATPTATVACTPGAWTAAAPVPIPISRYAFARNGQDLYVLGGVSNGSRVATVNRYNATTNVWTPLANIPVASEAPAAAFLNNKIFLVEGDTGDSFQIYDVATNTWSTGPSRPGVANNYGAAAGAFNGNVYIAGGNSAALNTCRSTISLLTHGVPVRLHHRASSWLAIRRSDSTSTWSGAGMRVLLLPTVP